MREGGKEKEGEKAGRREKGRREGERQEGRKGIRKRHLFQFAL